MEKQQLELLKKKASEMPKLELTDIGRHNIKVLKNRINNDNHDLKLAIDDFNHFGNSYKSANSAAKYIIDLLRCDALTDDEWNKVLPYINVFDFNKDYNNIAPSLKVLVDKLDANDWLKDLHLEFWQGGLSYNQHWANREGKVNSPENGSEYIQIIKAMKNLIDPLVEKYGTLAKETIIDRIEDNDFAYKDVSWNF